MKIPESWTFEDDGVAAGFDAHVKEQLPWYDVVSSGIVALATDYIPKRGGVVYDVGCSTGNISARLSKIATDRSCEIIGVEESPQMAAAWNGHGTLITSDCCEVDFKPFDVAVLHLVLMFIEPRKRKPLIGKMWAKCKPGGCMIVVDKQLPDQGNMAVLFKRLTWALKVSDGRDLAGVVEKEMSLRGIQRPVSSSEFPISPVKWFQMGEFAGWLLEKP